MKEEIIEPEELKAEVEKMDERDFTQAPSFDFVDSNIDDMSKVSNNEKALDNNVSQFIDDAFSKDLSGQDVNNDFSFSQEENINNIF